MEKMTIEKAREIIGEVNLDTRDVREEWWWAKGFIEGYESRQAEVEELKKEIELYKKSNETITTRKPHSLEAQ